MDMVTIRDYMLTERELAAREGRKGFVVHAAIYTVVMTGLIVLNLVLVAQTDSNFLWFPFPLIGWGIGLALHYLHGVRWLDREMKRHQAEIERLAADRRG
jgi:hypothetical protein